MLHDRNIFYNSMNEKCKHCRTSYKSVDHMATQCDRMAYYDYKQRHDEVLKCLHLALCKYYKISLNNKIRKHELQKFSYNDKVEIRIDTTVKSDIKIKHNSPEIYVVDNANRKIKLIEVGITSITNLTQVEFLKRGYMTC